MLVEELSRLGLRVDPEFAVSFLVLISGLPLGLLTAPPLTLMGKSGRLLGFLRQCDLSVTSIPDEPGDRHRSADRAKDNRGDGADHLPRLHTTMASDA